MCSLINDFVVHARRDGSWHLTGYACMKESEGSMRQQGGTMGHGEGSALGGDREELVIEFPDSASVVVRHGDVCAGPFPFSTPLTQHDRDELEWYRETYGSWRPHVHADHRADMVVSKVPGWSDALFMAVFRTTAAKRLLGVVVSRSREATLLVTIVARHACVLALPWQLLRKPLALRLHHTTILEIRLRYDPALAPSTSPCGTTGSSASLWSRMVPGGWRASLRRLCDAALDRIPGLVQRALTRGRRILTTNRLSRLGWLLVEVFFGRPEDIERPGSFTRKVATPVAMPLVAAGVFGVCLTLAFEQTLRASLGARAIPADQLLHLRSTLSLAAGVAGPMVAVVGIYCLATLNYATTAMAWRLFSLISPGGRVPAWRWFVSRASSGCAYFSLFVAASAWLGPYLHRSTTGPPAGSTAVTLLEQTARKHGFAMLVLSVLLVLLHQLRSRNVALVDRDIWGSRWKAVLMALLRVASPVGLAWLTVSLANR